MKLNRIGNQYSEILEKLAQPLIPDDGYADGGVPYNNEEMNLMNKQESHKTFQDMSVEEQIPRLHSMAEQIGVFAFKNHPEDRQLLDMLDDLNHHLSFLAQRVESGTPIVR